MPKKVAAAALALLSLTLWAISVPAYCAGKKPSSRDLVGAFVQMATKSEFSYPLGQSRQAPPEGIRKWEKDIEVVMIGTYPEDVLEMIRERLQLISEMTGRKISRMAAIAAPEPAGSESTAVFDLSSPDSFFHLFSLLPGYGFGAIAVTGRGKNLRVYSGNYFIFHGTREDLVKIARILRISDVNIGRMKSRSIPCLATAYTRMNLFELQNAYVLIPNDLSQRITRRCINEELTQSFGLFNDLPGSDLTLFNDANYERSVLTKIDELFLRTLYSKEIRPGDAGDALRTFLQKHFSAHGY